MLIIFLILLLSMLLSMRVSLIKNNKDYMSIENTQAIKGIFIIIVFMSHIRSYVVLDNNIDGLIIRGINYLGQLMVAMFLFYSGYGIYEAIKKKGKSYVNSLPKNRIWKTYTQFVWAIMCFLVVNLILGIEYPIRDILFAFTGWTSIGNSNWYMFAIFILYFITYISFKLCYKNFYLSFLLVVILSYAYIIVIQRYQGGWWCDTILCYAFGILYSYYKDRIDKFFNNTGCIGYYSFLALIVLVYFVGERYRFLSLDSHNIYAILFCMIIIVFSMKISFKSKILIWCGRNLFWLYILQRIPMIVFKHFGVAKYGGYIFISLCAIVTVLLSIGLPRLIERIQKMFHKIVENKNK